MVLELHQATVELRVQGGQVVEIAMLSPELFEEEACVFRGKGGDESGEVHRRMSLAEAEADANAKIGERLMNSKERCEKSCRLNGGCDRPLKEVRRPKWCLKPTTSKNTGAKGGWVLWGAWENTQ